MRIYLDQIGCRLNYSEMDTLAGQLRAAGHTLVADAMAAQVIVFNSCAVTAAAGRKSRQRVRQHGRANPVAQIAVTGCWATLRPHQAATLPGVELVVDNERKDLLAMLLEPWSAQFDDPDALAHVQPEGTPFGAATNAADAMPSRTRAFVKVQDGCNNRCTFCIVTVARGAARSRPVQAVVDEIRAQAAAGVQEAVLTGVHLGGYGRDLTGDARGDLAHLTRAILTETDIPRLRLSSLEPWELADGFFALWAAWPDRLCPHLHLPLQAGTDGQLRRMARRCTTTSFRRLVDAARAAIPDLTVTTDLITGFPGETAADFEAGLAFVDALRFADAHIFPFSARAGTAAATLDGQVDNATKKARARRLHEVIAMGAARERRRFLGTVRPVLWEGQGERLTHGAGCLWHGFTDNYLRVQAVAPEALHLRNHITSTRLVDLHGDTFAGIIDPTSPDELATTIRASIL